MKVCNFLRFVKKKWLRKIVEINMPSLSRRIYDWFLKCKSDSKRTNGFKMRWEEISNQLKLFLPNINVLSSPFFQVKNIFTNKWFAFRQSLEYLWKSYQDLFKMFIIRCNSISQLKYKITCNLFKMVISHSTIILTFKFLNNYFFLN